MITHILHGRLIYLTHPEIIQFTSFCPYLIAIVLVTNLSRLFQSSVKVEAKLVLFNVQKEILLRILSIHVIQNTDWWSVFSKKWRISLVIMMGIFHGLNVLKRSYNWFKSHWISGGVVVHFIIIISQSLPLLCNVSEPLRLLEWPTISICVNA